MRWWPVIIHTTVSALLFMGALLVVLYRVDERTTLGSFLVWLPFYAVMAYLVVVWRLSGRSVPPSGPTMSGDDRLPVPPRPDVSGQLERGVSNGP